MSICDYGAVVKKNGKIISTEMFENHSELKVNIDTHWEEYLDKNGDSCCKIVRNSGYIDESEVLGPNGKIVSMAQNYYKILGDKHFLIGFYKSGFDIAIDGKIREDLSTLYNGTISTWFWKHKKILILNLPEIGRMTVKLLADDYNNAFIASFYLKGDKYEVLFGARVDCNSNFVYCRKAYKHNVYLGWYEVSHYSWKKNKEITTLRKGCYLKEYKKLKRNMQKWFMNGGVK